MQTKSSLITIVGTLSFTVVVAIATMYAMNHASKTDLQLESKMASELIRLTITHEMKEGNPNHISPYLKDLAQVPGITHAHVVPAPSVIAQMGKDLDPGIPSSPLEEKVFASKKSESEILNNHTFHYALPYIAHTQSRCLQCHQAQEGDVLGVVSVEIDITEQRKVMMWSVGSLVGLLLLYGLVLMFTLRWLMLPVIATTKSLKRAFDSAEAGDFSQRVKKYTNDEMGEIAEKTNHFMQTLEGSLGEISKKVETLSHTYQSDDKNILLRTSDVVNNLVGAAHFKQSIENDRNLEEVYARLCRTLIGQFKVKRFSLYEVSNSKNRLLLIKAEGLPEASEMWCDREVTVDCDACRTKRSAHIVTSSEEENICPSFMGNSIQDADALKHTCFPIMLSGSVGGILQILFTQDEAARIHANSPRIQAYLAEAAPVIEAKRLMMSLKESSMRDPMTNLYNRRFLENYLETMLAGIQRQNASISILMCDVDYFKQVNDTLGHEAGDEVLITVSRILQEAIRASDLAIRFGGEEFLALLIGTTEDKAMEVAERIRSSMENHTFKTTIGPLKKTISIGVSVYPQDSDAFWECVKFSDVAMYEAKESGRNRILRFTKNMWKEGQSY